MGRIGTALAAFGDRVEATWAVQALWRLCDRWERWSFARRTSCRLDAELAALVAGAALPAAAADVEALVRQGRADLERVDAVVAEWARRS